MTERPTIDDLGVTFTAGEALRVAEALNFAEPQGERPYAAADNVGFFVATFVADALEQSRGSFNAQGEADVESALAKVRAALIPDAAPDSDLMDAPPAGGDIYTEPRELVE